MTGWQPPEAMELISLSKYIGKEVTQMTSYEIISVILDIASLLIANGMFLIALLTFLDKKNKRK